MSSPKDQNFYYYQRYYQFEGRSEWMDRIWREAFGENYPEGLDHYGYLTRHDLQAMARMIRCTEGSVMLDMGCGKGGPGLKLAEELGLQLIGVDIVPEAVDQAAVFQEEFRLLYPAVFRVGDFYDIPLPDHSVDVAISIDSIWAVPNKIQALIMMKRVLKPGASFIFSQWDLLSTDPIALLELSGLQFVSREETPLWKEYQQKVYAGIQQYRAELVEEMGEAADMLLYEADVSPPHLDLSVRRLYEFRKPVEGI